jgi:hypothetical protein
MASSEMENHTPRYLFFGTPAEKKPRVNDPPADTSLSPSVMLRPLVRVSEEALAARAVTARRSRERRTRRMLFAMTEV